MPSPRQDLLAQKRKLEQQIAHIDAGLQMLCSYAVVEHSSVFRGFPGIWKTFDNYRDAHCYVTKHNQGFDYSCDKWERGLLYLLPFKWTDTDKHNLVHPSAWWDHPEYGLSIDSSCPLDLLECPGDWQDEQSK